MNAPVEASPKNADALKSTAPPQPLSLRQPVWHVLVLSILTCKLYLVYWYYKNLRDLATHLKEAEPTAEVRGVAHLLPANLSQFANCNVMLRTLCACIPHVQDYMFLTMTLGVARLQERNGFEYKHAVTLAVAMGVFSFAASFMAKLEGALFLLYLLSIVPFMYVQHMLNKYWDRNEPRGLLFRAGFTGGELAIVVVGALFLGFIVAGFIMGVNR